MTWRIKYLTAGAIAISLLLSCNGKKENKSVEEEPMNLTLMSYNVHNGKGLDTITDYNRIGEFLKENNPDVVAIQEVDSATSRSDGRFVLGEIANAAGMKAYFSPSIDYAGGKYGIGILSKNEPLAVKRYSLPGSEETRSVIVVEFPAYVFACTHLSLTEADRDSSAIILKTLASEYEKPFFIAGDFNAEPESNFIKVFSENFTPLSGTTTPTFPANEPEIVIDYIMSFNNADVEVVEVVVPEEKQMSDHRPVKAKIRIE